MHTLCIDGPAFDQVTTLSKFLCLGMPLADVIAATTVNAAMALKRPELGSLKPGSVGDATVLTIREGRFDYVDVVGEHLEGRPQDRLGRRRGRRPLVASGVGWVNSGGKPGQIQHWRMPRLCAGSSLRSTRPAQAARAHTQ